MERVGHIVDTSVNEGAKLVAGKSKIAATSMQQYNISLINLESVLKSILEFITIHYRGM